MPPIRRSGRASSNRPSICEGEASQNRSMTESGEVQAGGELFGFLRSGNEDGLAARVEQKRAEDCAAAQGGGSATRPDLLGGFFGGWCSNQSDEFAGSETPFTYVLKQASSSSSPPPGFLIQCCAPPSFSVVEHSPAPAFVWTGAITHL